MNYILGERPARASDLQKSQPFFILLLLVLTLMTLGKMLGPFIGVILVSCGAYLLCRKYYKRLEQKIPNRSRSTRAALGTLIVFLVILAPLILFCWTAMRQSHALGPVVREWNDSLEAFEDGKLTHQMNWFRPIRAKIATSLGLTSRDVQRRFVDSMHAGLEKIDGFVAQAAGNILMLMVRVFLFLVLLFFLFRDGPYYAKRMRDWLPLEPRFQEQLFSKLNLSFHVILKGWFLSALVQGGTATIGYAMLHLPGAVFLGCITAMTTVIPYVGTAIVWGPAALLLAMQGAYVKAAFLFFWGAIVVGLIDNLLAPLIIQQKTNLPFPLLLLSIFGGLSIFGLAGLLLGPLVVLLAPTLLDIYRHAVMGPPPVIPLQEPAAERRAPLRTGV